MSYEMQDVIQESPASQTIESGSLFSEAYQLSTPQQFRGSEENQVRAQSEVNQTFGALEIFDSVNFSNKSGKDAGGKPQSGATEKIGAAISEEEDGTLVMDYKDGTSSRISKDGERVLEFDKEGRQVTISDQDTSDFDKDGKLDSKPPIGPQATPEQINKAVDELLNRGALPDLEFFEKRPEPRADGEIRERTEPDKNGGERTTTEYPNGITIAKIQQRVRNDDGTVTIHEERLFKGPEGFKESPKGTYVDKNDKPLAKENDDGTMTLFLEKDGKKLTATEFPGGIKTFTAPTIVRDGQTVQAGRKDTFPEGSSVAADGTVLDKKGNQIAKNNADGSLTIFAPDGTYTQQLDGKVTFQKKQASKK